MQLFYTPEVSIKSDQAQTLPTEMREAFRQLQRLLIIRPEVAAGLIASVGFRNTAIHEYRKLEWAIIFKIAARHLEDFENFIRHVEAYKPVR